MMLAFVLIGAAAAADAPDWRKADLKDVAFEFRLVQDVDEIERLLGDRLDNEFILVEVRLRALYGTKVNLDRTAFLFRSFRDNQQSTAQSPDLIAGSDVLSLKPGGGSGSAVYSQSREGIPVGGVPGTTGRPRRLGNPVPDTIGGPVGSGTSSATTVRQMPAQEQDLSLYGRLERLELPLDAGDADVSGYLYFQVDPKHNRKHLSLSYDGRYGEFRVSFEK
ncbi:MAG: hypothetical protein O3A53_11970 [Acidobacteria bacterium]|nr:hypothetical protein [Acidobacteriota bacterium]